MLRRRRQQTKSCSFVVFLCCFFFLFLVILLHIAQAAAENTNNPLSNDAQQQQEQERIVLHCTQHDGSTVCTFTIPSSSPKIINQELADCTEDRCVMAKIQSSIVSHREKEKPTIVVSEEEKDVRKEQMLKELNNEVTFETATSSSDTIQTNVDNGEESRSSSSSKSLLVDDDNRNRQPPRQRPQPKRPLPDWYLKEKEEIGNVYGYEDDDPVMEFAEWWLSTGLASSQSSADDGNDHLGTTTSSTFVDDHLEEAIEYFEDTAKDFHKSHPYEDTEQQIKSARLWVYVGESYLFYPPSNQQATKRAKEAFETAAKLYQVLLERPDDEETTKEKIEVKYADALVRLGVLVMDLMGDAQQGALALGDLEKYATEMEEATNFLRVAVDIYRRRRRRLQKEENRNDDNDDATTDVTISLANVLQSYGTAITMGTNDMVQATKLFEESLGYYEELMAARKRQQQSPNNEYDNNNNNHHDDLVMSIAPLTQTLADMYLQLERYDESKVAYRKTMEYFKTNPEVVKTIVVDVQLSTISLDANDEFGMMNDLNPDDILVEYEQELRYLNQQGGNQAHDDFYWSQQANIHTTLGALYMGNGNVEQAVHHFLQAKDSFVALGEDDEVLRSIADLNLNLSMALQRLGEYDESSSAHDEAVDLYQSITPKGTNPLMDGFMDMDMTGFEGFAGGGGGAASVMSNAEMNVKDTKPQQRPDDEAAAGSSTREAIKDAVAKRLINLDTLTSNFMNHSVKEEL